MTTGEYLVANSPLPSGTALAHLLALQFGAGQGETVFASRFCVVAGEDRLEVVNRPKTKAPVENLQRRPPESSPSDKRAYPFSTTPSVSVFAGGEDAVSVVERQNTALAIQDFGQITINRKKGQS